MRFYRLEARTPVPVDSVREWAQWFKMADTRVASTQVGDARVLTVFLGVDVSGADPPCVFETVVLYHPENGARRTSTWDEALAAHAELVARVSCR